MSQETTIQTGTTAAPFDWDALLPAQDAPAAMYQVGAKTNVRTDIPKPIRQRVEEALDATTKALAKAKVAGTKLENVPPQWKLQPVADSTQGDALLKLMRKYAQYRPGQEEWGEGLEFYVPGNPVGQLTVRGAVVEYAAKGAKSLSRKENPAKLAPRDVAPGWYVRYAAKAKEAGKKDASK